ncbi:EpsG-like putative glucosyltransferase [Pseudomonas lurida]|uniref:EpsG family protein n=1 Tax=Pseudomonas lurida TaxID=244566 RepID=UPI000C00DA53|nr:EpsG-like putative glucosyltransferase [Pseudomonas lurida]
MIIYLLGYLIIFYIAILRFFTLRRDLPLTLLLYILVGIIGGIRYETGMDWPQYSDYFDSISVEQGLYTSYLSNNYKLAFEFGYFLLNYLIKYLGGGVEIVFLTASLFCALSTYLLSSFFPGNRIFIFAIYISYNFIYMHFSTVRQSIAVGLFFIALWIHLKFSNKKLMILALALCVCFQISALLYLFIFFCSFFVRDTYRYIYTWSASILIIFIAIHFGSNPYEILSTILPSSFASKLMEYAVWDFASSTKTYLFGLYIAFCAFNLSWLERIEKNKTPKATMNKKENFVVKLSITSLLLSATFIILFPNNFALWTRTFNVASVLFACALSSFYYSSTGRYRIIFFLHLVIAAVSFVVSLYAAQEAMSPYRTIL